MRRGVARGRERRKQEKSDKVSPRTTPTEYRATPDTPGDGRDLLHSAYIRVSERRSVGASEHFLRGRDPTADGRRLVSSSKRIPQRR
ncbi:unnamed protein product [Lota lota]